MSTYGPTAGSALILARISRRLAIRIADPASRRYAAIACGALVVAALTGHYMADGRMKYALALVVGACYAPVLLLDITLGFAIYVAVLFVQDISALSVAPNSMGVLVLLAWAGTFFNRAARTSTLREHSRLLSLLALLAVWLTLSITWATNSYEAGNGVQDWGLALLAFVLTLTTIRDMRGVAVIAVAFIAGAVVSTIYGVASGALSAPASGASEVAQQGRFTGGGGDPNVQAAGFLVAMFVCSGMWGLARSRRERVALMLAFVTVTIGFFATQSRGGFISLACAALVGFVALPRQRKKLLALAGAGGIGLGLIAMLSPGAISRITDLGGGTTGRSSVWAVAWRIFKFHPWVGVGLNNFPSVEPRYALQSGPLTRVDLVAEVPHLVHNVYLQLLAETGVVGLALFALAVGGCIRASWRASRRFDRIGELRNGDVARAVLLAEIAMLSAQFFISDGEDLRLWIVMALGLVLASIAGRDSAQRTAQTHAATVIPLPGSPRRPSSHTDPRSAPRSPRASSSRRSASPQSRSPRAGPDR